MKPKKFVHEYCGKEPEVVEEEHYTAADYATPGAAGQLYREGQKAAADAVLSMYGEDGGDLSSMDPMELLILSEELGELE